MLGIFVSGLFKTFFFSVSEYSKEMPHSHNADQLMTPRGRGTEHHQPHDSKETLKSTSTKPQH